MVNCDMSLIHILRSPLVFKGHPHTNNNIYVYRHFRSKNFRELYDNHQIHFHYSLMLNKKIIRPKKFLLRALRAACPRHTAIT